MLALLLTAVVLIPRGERSPARPLAWRDLSRQLGPLRFPHAWGTVYRSRRNLAVAIRGLSPQRPLPRIDFVREDAVLLALGPRSSTGYDVAVLSVREEDERVLVMLAERAPSLGRHTRARLAFPYRLLALPHTGKRISLHWKGH